MKDYDDISDLIVRFLNGDADRRQIERLEQWLDASERNRNIFHRLCRDLESGHRYVRVDTQRALRIVERRNARNRLSRRIRYAAAAAVLLFVAGAGFLLLRENSAPEPLRDWSEVAAEVVLTLPDGSSRAIEGVFAADTLGVSRDSSGLLRVGTSEPIRDAEPEYCEITVGTGPEQTLEFSDGTRVWLGNYSRLRFPLCFESDHRRVEASGEIYFDVAPDPDRPFVVAFENASIRVLGTEFLIQQQQGRSVATLVEGEVSFTTAAGQSVVMHPGNQAETAGAEIELREVDTRLYTALRDGFLLFDRMTLGEIARRLETRYECRIRFGRETAAREVISARIQRYPTLRPILDLLAKVGHFQYKEEGGDIVIE